LAAAVSCLDAVWKDCHRYQKGGILLVNFFSQDVAQLYLFDDTAPHANATALMDILTQSISGTVGVRFFLAGHREEMADKRGDAVAPLAHSIAERA